MTQATAGPLPACPVCGRTFRPRPQAYGVQKTCSPRCGATLRWTAVHGAAGIGPDRRTWLLTELNRGIPVRTLAELHGVSEMTLRQWMRRLGIRRVVRYE